jgi:hypothetical protein
MISYVLAEMGVTRELDSQAVQVTEVTQVELMNSIQAAQSPATTPGLRLLLRLLQRLKAGYDSNQRKGWSIDFRWSIPFAPT